MLTGSHMQVAGGWSQQTLNKVYAQLPAADGLAQRAGFTGRNTFMCYHMLLDPAAFTEDPAMVPSIFAGVEDLLPELQQVHGQHQALPCTAPETRPAMNRFSDLSEYQRSRIARQACCCDIELHLLLRTSHKFVAIDVARRS